MQQNYLDKKYSRIIVGTLLLIVMFSFKSAGAQSVSQDIALELFPQNPGPKERIVVSISSINIDLARAEIVWSTDGKVAKRGVGLTTFIVSAPDLGRELRLDVGVKSSMGTISKSVVVRPAGVEILWYAHGYVPPLYKGKALHTSESSITASAMPHFILRGVPLSSESLFYQWRLNNTFLGNQSGLGKQTIQFVGAALFGKDTLSVEVSTKDRALVGNATITIDTVNPKVLFYEDSPLLGTLYTQALSSSYFLTKEELTVRAEPYFFSQKELEDGVDGTWHINGTRLNNNPEFARGVTLRQTGGSGEAILTYSIEATTRALQDASRSLTIFFGQ